MAKTVWKMVNDCRRIANGFDKDDNIKVMGKVMGVGVMKILTKTISVVINILIY